jgi:predicted ribosome quality control (RQC) complex YloA/Tae2 family protein
MALDGILLSRILTPLQALCPVKIQRIYNLSENEILLNIRSNKEKYQLLLSAHSVHNRIQLSNQNFVPPQEPSNFVMLLRKHIEDGLILSIKQIGLDRLVEISIQKRNEMGDLHQYTLMIELMGKYANIVFVDEENRIMDALKRIPAYENSKRTIHPGADYTLPEQQVRMNPFINDYNPSLTIMEQFHGFSPLLAREIEHRLRQSEDFRTIMNEIHTSNDLHIVKDKEEVFHCIPLTHVSSSFKVYSLMEGLDHIYQALEEKERIKQHSGDVIKFIQREFKKAQTKRPKLLEAYDEALDCEKWRTFGDYLYAYGMQLPKGLKTFDVNDFETDAIITIPLDEKYDGKQNAQRYYNKYQKGKKGQAHILNQLRINQDEQDYFQALTQQLALASVHDAIEIKEELIRGAYIRAKLPKRSPKQVKVHYLQLNLDHDIRIYVGKNNLQNETITFKIGQKKDLWFHAKDYHGAHVLLQGENITNEHKNMAACLSAFYSKARGSKKTEVQVALIKDIKKIPDSKPGLVSVTQYTSVYVEPIEEEIAQWIKDYQVK